MEDIFKTLGNILKPEVTNSTLQTILNEIGKPFHYSISFHGDSHYSKDGQLWGTNSIEVTKSKTAITVKFQRKEDIRPFETAFFIRSINELKAKIEEVSQRHNEYFKNFG